MRIRPHRNSDLVCYARRVGAIGVFARYVLSRRPEATSLAALNGEEVAGVAVFGPAVGLYEASSCWVFADSTEGFTKLALRLDADGVAPLNFHLRHLEAIPTGKKISIDRFYTVRESEFRARPTEERTVRLSRKQMAALRIPDELRPYLGAIANIPDDFPYYGVVREGTLVALAETAVRDEEVATIQQVFTLPSLRGQGLAGEVVACACRDLLAAGMTPTYFVAEDNTASIALVESLGFQLDSRWGFAD